jgi:hypothetical protein
MPNHLTVLDVNRLEFFPNSDILLRLLPSVAANISYPSKHSVALPSSHSYIHCTYFAYLNGTGFQDRDVSTNPIPLSPHLTTSQVVAIMSVKRRYWAPSILTH